MTMRLDLPYTAKPVGQSPIYGLHNVPGKLWNWHAPRVNRWEVLSVLSAGLSVRREVAGCVRSVVQRVTKGEPFCIAPGVRWQLHEVTGDAAFVIESYVDREGRADAPYTARHEWLVNAKRISVGREEFSNRDNGLFPDCNFIIADCNFPLETVRKGLEGDACLCWYPLTVLRTRCTIIGARAAEAVSLHGYLRHEHAIIEAAFGSALAGNIEHLEWFRYVLSRHLHVEEELVFPAYIATGGSAELVHGLKIAHQFLRQYMSELRDPGNQQKLLNLLDGHDDEEERMVYPDMVQRLGEQTVGLLDRARQVVRPYTD